MNDFDGFQALCQRDPVNARARQECSYTLWPDQSLATRLSSLAPGAQIFILHPTAEAGMPHTRGPNRICLPAYFPDSRAEETIRHELVHLDQRARPKAWQERLVAEGWTPVEEEEIPLEWRRKCRLNPDTVSARFWMWQTRWIPMPVFQRDDAPRLRDVETWWWDRQEEHASRTPPRTFTARYGSVSSSEAEHPYELYAYRGIK
jgi:hypothetical protein